MDYQDKNFEYTNAKEYDRRAENSVLENYVLGLWLPFLKKTVADLSSRKIVVDLGCGTCEYTEAAKTAKKIYAVDISEPMLKVCQEKLSDFSQAEIIRMAVQDFKLPIDSADLVIQSEFGNISCRKIY
ncbi:MAG: class I SAM-dependent methyltransferase [Candidatus Azambacteria bacterium]|nr:class I SAM-dependent methyltransferase [Candidatus Azambacteria bacterium]